MLAYFRKRISGRVDVRIVGCPKHPPCTNLARYMSDSAFVHFGRNPAVPPEQLGRLVAQPRSKAKDMVLFVGALQPMRQPSGTDLQHHIAQFGEAMEYAVLHHAGE